MLTIRSIIFASAIPGLICSAAAAQQPAPAILSPSQPSASPTSPSGVVATTNNPNLSVATVKLESGIRATKVIGATVTSDTNEQIGTIDDLILTAGNRVTVAIVSVGGFLGIGSKLVALPFDQLKFDAHQISLPGASRESLNAMPSFVY